MGFWSINPYVGCAFGCAYCYARYAHRYVAERATAGGAAADGARDLVELPAWLAFERRIFVKRNAAEVLRAALRADGARAVRGRRGRLTKLWHGESIAIGTATDPYQPAERTYRVTRAVLEVLAEERGLSIGITTKSPLITRDIDVLTRLAGRSELTVHVSLITLDRELARRIEPRAPTPESRLRAVERLAAAGIDVGINIMPVLPGITDPPAMLGALVRRVAASGASHINACALRLRVTARKRYLPFIEAEFPHLAARYRAAYAGSHQMGDRYREGLRRFLRERCREYGITYGMPAMVETGSGDDDEAAGAFRVSEAGESGDAQLALPLAPEPTALPGGDSDARQAVSSGWRNRSRTATRGSRG
jgi:DNA repair photolyase